jgi:uncharacterized membrane protein
MMNFFLYHTPLYYLIQSLWRDEAFSFFMAKPSIFQIIQNTAQDFNPPLYYILLHFWIAVVGQSDELLRTLSFVFHLATVYVGFQFAKKLFSKKYAYFVGLFIFLNPMLLYYSFEMRMYSLYALASLASIYFLYTRQWKKYIVATIAGLYTHSFFPLIVMSYIFIYRFIPHMKKKDVFKIGVPVLFYIPWLVVLVGQFFRSANSWLFPVDLQLIKSVLGNLFTSYEGTPGALWTHTAVLSAILLSFFIFLLKRNWKKGVIFLVPIIFPLFIIIGYSILKRPLFVNRYLIFITVFEILSVSYAIWCIRNRKLRIGFMFMWLLLCIGINIFLTPYKKKTDFKTTFAEIHRISRPDDYAFSKTPIGFLETAYYFQNPTRVFVYNPENIAIPDYIGSNVVFPQSSRYSFPPSPSRTFLIDDEARYEMIVRN